MRENNGLYLGQACASKDKADHLSIHGAQQHGVVGSIHLASP